MLSARDINEVTFADAKRGYDKDEVDNFLDTIEADYREIEAYLATAQAKIEDLNAEINDLKNSQNSIQSVLISAQQLADKIVADAKAKADEIMGEAAQNAQTAANEAKNMIVDFDAKFTEKKAAAEKDFEEQMAAAQKKKEAVEAAANDAVHREQVLFDRLRIEVAAFKADLMEQYKKHLELLSKIPDAVQMDAKRAAEAVAMAIDEKPDVAAFVPAAEPVADPFAEEEEEVYEEAPLTEEEAEEPSGFTVNVPDSAEALTDLYSSSDEEDEADDFGFQGSFFKRK